MQKPTHIIRIVLFVILGLLIHGFVVNYKHNYKFSIMGFGVVKDKVLEKDGLKIRLIGMSHFAAKSFYDNLKGSLKYEDGKVITLTEGVTNRSNMKRPEINRQEFAQTMKLFDQTTSIKFPNEVNSDVDYSDLNPKTISYLNNIFQFMPGASRDPANKDEKSNSWSSFIKASENENEKVAINDILNMRNDHLISVIKSQIKSRKYDTILVPWGAAHLQDIEERLVSQEGFKVTKIEFRYSMNNFVFIYRFLSRTGFSKFK